MNIFLQWKTEIYGIDEKLRNFENNTDYTDNITLLFRRIRSFPLFIYVFQQDMLMKNNY